MKNLNDCFGFQGKAPIQSEVQVSFGNGHGSTANKVRIFSVLDKSVGNGITYSASAVLGSRFIINEAGVYSVTYTDQCNGTGYIIGVTVNADVSAQATALQTVTFAQGRRAINGLGSAGNAGCVNWTGWLNVGDIVRPQTDGNPDVTSSTASFAIVKLSGPGSVG